MCDIEKKSPRDGMILRDNTDQENMFWRMDCKEMFNGESRDENLCRNWIRFDDKFGESAMLWKNMEENVNQTKNWIIGD